MTKRKTEDKSFETTLRRIFKDKGITIQQIVKTGPFISDSDEDWYRVILGEVFRVDDVPDLNRVGIYWYSVLVANDGKHLEVVMFDKGPDYR